METTPGEPLVSFAPPKPRLWFGLVFVISGLLAPIFPAFTLSVGVVVAVLVLLYVASDPTGPMRRMIGSFLRVSTDRPTWRTAKLTIFGLVAVALMGFALAGYAAKGASAEVAAKKAADEASRAQAHARLAAKKAADEAARVEAEVKANAQVTRLVDWAKAALTAGNVAVAQQNIDKALKLSTAQNRDVALTLQASIKNADDPAWALDLLLRLSDAELESFKARGNPPASLDLDYPVLTRKAVANARANVDAALSKRAEIRKQEQEAAEAAKQKAAAEAEERRKVAEAKAAAEAEERRKAAEARAATEVEAARKAQQARKWYEGGTLQNKSALQWQVASPQDKLATCADFVARTWEGKGFIARIQNSINSVDDMKPYAQELVVCLDAATKSDPDPEQNKRMYANQSAAEMAAACMILMGW